MEQPLKAQDNPWKVDWQRAVSRPHCNHAHRYVIRWWWNEWGNFNCSSQLHKKPCFIITVPLFHPLNNNGGFLLLLLLTYVNVMSDMLVLIRNRRVSLNRFHTKSTFCGDLSCNWMCLTRPPSLATPSDPKWVFFCWMITKSSSLLAHWAQITHRTTWLLGRKVRINSLACLQTLKTKSIKICQLLILGSPAALETC